jgi:type I restriction enzyme, S subunit
LGTGATFKELSGGKLKEVPIPLPPLPQQRRIVAILDVTFAGLATATANTQRNLKNARELFDSYVDSVFEKHKERWPARPLQSVYEVFDDGDWIETRDQSPTGIRLIQTGNIGNGYFKDRGEKARFISASTFNRLRCTEIFEGDCLISRLPVPVGRACLLPASEQRMITAVDCTIVRFIRNAVVSAFFVYYSQSRAYATAIEKQTTGATRQRISRKNLGGVAIPIPATSEQKRIVEKLSELERKVHHLASLYETRLSDLQTLKQSILNKAFSGELTSPPSSALKEAAE